MQIHPASFPNNRRTDPKRQGELKVYTELSATPTVGLAIYGGKAGPDSPEEDFVLWLHKEVRASVEVKGGETSFEYGQWILPLRPRARAGRLPGDPSKRRGVQLQGCGERSLWPQGLHPFCHRIHQYGT